MEAIASCCGAGRPSYAFFGVAMAMTIGSSDRAAEKAVRRLVYCSRGKTGAPWR